MQKFPAGKSHDALWSNCASREYSCVACRAIAGSYGAYLSVGSAGGPGAHLDLQKARRKDARTSTSRSRSVARPPLPPFTAETAAQKARLAEDAWNTRDPARVA